jgi:hypothetical protein
MHAYLVTLAKKQKKIGICLLSTPFHVKMDICWYHINPCTAEGFNAHQAAPNTKADERSRRAMCYAQPGWRGQVSLDRLRSVGSCM